MNFTPVVSNHWLDSLLSCSWTILSQALNRTTSNVIIFCPPPPYYLYSVSAWSYPLKAKLWQATFYIPRQFAFLRWEALVCITPMTFALVTLAWSANILSAVYFTATQLYKMANQTLKWLAMWLIAWKKCLTIMVEFKRLYCKLCPWNNGTTIVVDL